MVGGQVNTALWFLRAGQGDMNMAKELRLEGSTKHLVVLKGETETGWQCVSDEEGKKGDKRAEVLGTSVSQSVKHLHSA